MKPTPFRYERATTVDHVTALLAEHGDEAKVLAGGQSLVPMISMHLARPAVLIDVNGLADLDFVRVVGAEVSIGALARHRTVEEDMALRAAQPVFGAAGRLVGHYPIRVRGTFGGSLAHADPASEWCLLALLLGGEATVVSSRGMRRISSDDLFAGFLTTSLEPDELLVDVRLPDAGARRASVQEVSRRHGDFAVVLAGVAVEFDGDRCVDARVALGGVAGTVVRSPSAESVLRSRVLTPEVIAEAVAAARSDVDPASDVHADAWYRRHLVGVLVERCIGDVLAAPVPVVVR